MRISTPRFKILDEQKFAQEKKVWYQYLALDKQQAILLQKFFLEVLV